MRSHLIRFHFDVCGRRRSKDMLQDERDSDSENGTT
jgi:hypothetical protein